MLRLGDKGAGHVVEYRISVEDTVFDECRKGDLDLVLWEPSAGKRHAAPFSDPAEDALCRREPYGLYGDLLVDLDPRPVAHPPAAGGGEGLDGKSLIRAGVAGSDVHNAVVKLFDEQGYESGAKGFVHSLGHGVGLEVHESPSLSPSGGPLAAGNVVTVEPGLYYAGIGGVRIEDMGVVTTGGFDCYTDYSRELIV